MILVAVGGHETGYVYVPQFMILANALRKEFSILGGLEDVVCAFVLTLLFVT